MKEIIITLWERIWPLISVSWVWIFSQWHKTLPYLEKLFEFFKNTYSTLSNFIFNFLTYLKQQYILLKPIALTFAEKEPIWAGIILLTIILSAIFWISMLKHAKKNELVWRKFWLFIIFILGPLGALLYYFLRKKYLERKENAHSKVMLSFFTPMNKQPGEISKKN